MLAAQLDSQIQPQPRARGAVDLHVAPRAGATVLKDLRQSGSLKVLFPRNSGDELTAVLLNTAGGITGGDRFDVSAVCGADGHLVVTTQAAERAYRAQPTETGQLRTKLSVQTGGRLDWLPQETILYDYSDLNRRLQIDLARDACALIVEPLVFGRIAMGEVLSQARFCDAIDVRRDGKVLFADRTRLDGPVHQLLQKQATGAGCGAMAGVIYTAPDAERFLDPARALLSQTDAPGAGAVSLVRDGLLFARLLAPDSFLLRKSLLPLIRMLSPQPLPRTWMT